MTQAASRFTTYSSKHFPDHQQQFFVQTFQEISQWIDDYWQNDMKARQCDKRQELSKDFSQSWHPFDKLLKWYHHYQIAIEQTSRLSTHNWPKAVKIRSPLLPIVTAVSCCLLMLYSDDLVAL
jgi:hypothetical protein